MTGKELRTIRKRLEISQAGLARLLGVAQNTVGRWERDELGISEPAARLVRILAGAPVPEVTKTRRKKK